MLNFQEEELRALSQVLVPITVSEVIDTDDFRFLSINTAHTDASGLEEESIIGRSPRDLLPEAEAKTVIQRYQSAVQTGLPHTYEELLSLPKGQFWWRTSISPVKDNNGAVRRLCVSSIPVDQEVRLRQMAQTLVEDIVKIRSKQPVVDRCFADSGLSLEAMRIVADRIEELRQDFSPSELELIRYVAKLANDADASLKKLKKLGASTVADTLSQALMGAGPLSDLLKETVDKPH